MNDHRPEAPDKCFWLTTMFSVWLCSFLAGAAVGPRALDDDAAVWFGLLLSGLLALGQLVNAGRARFVFLRCAAIPGLFLLGLGWGMQTGFVLVGQRGRGLAAMGAAGHLMVAGVAVLYGAISGAAGTVLGLLASKTARLPVALPRPLVTDASYRRQAMRLGVLAPPAVAVYLALRYAIENDFGSSPQGFWSMSARANRTVVYLGVLDLLFVVGVAVAMIYLLMGAMAASRRIRAA